MFISTSRYHRKDEEYKPTYICDKCGKKITEYKPIRVSFRKYEEGKADTVVFDNKDYCNRCYKILKAWVDTPATKKEG